jgi:REP element-mobilizing transposase RayT
LLKYQTQKQGQSNGKKTKAKYGRFSSYNKYKCDEDKDKYLEILCKACRTYKVNVHDYCLMDNHYHLLIETTSENLSLFMRQINSNYAIYFNKKYKRTGHLWQGRYKSSIFISILAIINNIK